MISTSVVRSRLADSHGVRVFTSLCIAILAASFVLAHSRTSPTFVSDFDQVWAGARALADGRSPYAAVGPDAPFKWKWPLYYPLPAIAVGSVFGVFPIGVARALFAGLGAGLFAFAISSDGWSRWPIFLSVTFYVSIDLVQWSPLIAAGYFLPWLGAIACCKPNFSLPLLVGARQPGAWLWMAAGGLALTVVSFALYPRWADEWLVSLRGAPHFIPPVARSGGFLMLLAALRWRRPEARWLLALSVIPQAPSFYDQLLLIAVCNRWWEAGVLSISTYVLFFYVGAHTPQPDYQSWGRLVGDASLWFCFLPMLAIVLSRPNEGVLLPVRDLFGVPQRR